MVNTKIRLIIFFAAKDREALYSQQNKTDELWTEVHDTVQETGSKTITNKKKCKKAKWLSEEPYK